MSSLSKINILFIYLFSWTIGLKEQTKILDAYSMLKKQGIVKQDPKFDERLMLPTPPPRYFFKSGRPRSTHDVTWKSVG